MNWINTFELLCYAITLVCLADMIRKKLWEDLLLFISAAVAGFALELLAVRVTDIYHYSQDYFISIGFRPYQFPFFGGLMWGGLTVYALRTAEKRRNLPVAKRILAAVCIDIAGVAFVGAASGIALLLNAVTDEWFAGIAFILLWIFVLVIILKSVTGGMRERHACLSQLSEKLKWRNHTEKGPIRNERAKIDRNEPNTMHLCPCCLYAVMLLRPDCTYVSAAHGPD